MLSRQYGAVDVDELYGLPLDRFVAERGRLAQALRAAGRRDEAAVVAGLRKPSAAAWAVNQLVRTQSRALADLFDAGDVLRDVQSGVLAGGRDGRALRRAAEHERATVNALVHTARGLLTREGHELSPAILDRVADTLHAGALSDEARTKMREGRLARELRHVGLGVDADADSASLKRLANTATPSKDSVAKPSGRPVSEARAVSAREKREERARIANERAAATLTARERAEARRVARASEGDARRQADRAVRAVHAAEERRDRAVRALRDADEALARARADEQAAAEACRRANEQLAGL